MSDNKKTKYVIDQVGESRYVLTDLEYGVSVKFDEHAYNSSQKIEVSEDSSLRLEGKGTMANDLANILGEMGEYMFNCHYSLAMPTPKFELKEDWVTGKRYLIRHTSPKFVIEVEEDCSDNKLASTLKKAAAFLQHRKKMDGNSI